MYRTSSSLLALVFAMGNVTGANAQSASSSTDSIGMESVVVTGQRAQQERSIDAKRSAIGVVDVSASDDIGRLPDRNVAEVVEHLPGVGVTYDQGEGRYVAVRGVPSNLNGYTVDGFELGAPDGQTRSVPLDLISGQLLNRVEVAKVKTVDQDGQGIGATINLVTQTAFDYQDPFKVVVNAAAGYQELRSNDVPVRADASVAHRFGPDEQFGIVLGGSYSDRTYTSYGFYPDNWTPNTAFARGGVPSDMKYTNYTLERERIGGSGSFDWRPDEHNQFYVRGVYSRYAEHEIRPRYRLDFNAAAGLNADGLTGTTNTGTARREDERLDNKIKSTLMGMVGGKSEFDDLSIDYGAAYVSNRVEDRYPLWQFRCSPGPVKFDFTDKIFTAAAVNECTPAQMKFNSYNAFAQKTRENIWQGKVDATLKLPSIGEGSFLRAGLKYRDSDRDFDQNTDVWNAGSTALTLGMFDLAGPSFSVYPDGSKPGFAYINSPTINPATMLSFTSANLNNPLYFKKDVATSLANDTLSDFNLRERVTSAYAESNLGFGDWTITAGLRFEHTELGDDGNQLQNGTVITPVSVGTSYDSWLPSVIVAYRPIDETVFRLAYSRSLGRPEYSDLNPGGSVDTLNDALSLGNPNLKPYVSDNVDATGEWYFARGGLLAVGAFDKSVQNPVFSQTTVETNATFNGQTFPLLQVSQPFNAQSGDIYGIEAQFQQQLTFLPGPLSGLGVQVTGTLTHSELHLPTGRVSTFPQQSNTLYGVSLFYQMGPAEASIAYHVTGHALLAVGTPAYNDQYNDDLHRLDAKASVGVLENVRLFFEAQNLTDEPTRQYQAGNSNWIIQNERYGRTFYMGASADF